VLSLASLEEMAEWKTMSMRATRETAEWLVACLCKSVDETDEEIRIVVNEEMSGSSVPWRASASAPKCCGVIECRLSAGAAADACASPLLDYLAERSRGALSGPHKPALAGA
jgi:hypothetical protein